ncbi:MAG: hypothetical protein ABI851_09070 [Saprospiraceae bacterium]
MIKSVSYMQCIKNNNKYSIFGIAIKLNIIVKSISHYQPFNFFLLKLILLVFIISNQLAHSQIISNIEFKFNNCYIFTDRNINYRNKLFDVHLPNYYRNSEPFPNLSKINGIIENYNYISIDPEIILRRRIYKNIFDCGFNLGYKRFVSKHNVYYNPGGDFLNAVLLSRVNFSYHSINFGLLLSYKIPSLKTRIQVGVEHYGNFLNNSWNQYILIAQADNFQYTNTTLFSGDGYFKRGKKVLSVQFDYCFKKNWLVGAGIKISRYGNFFESIGIFDYSLDKNTHNAYIEDKLLQASFNIAYVINIKKGKRNNLKNYLLFQKYSII